MTKSRRDYTEANRAAWDASAPYHRDADGFARLRQAFEQPGYSRLDALATEELQSLGVVGADVAQLCCNNGREILSIKNIGARSCVGFDQSGEFLAHACELAAAGNIDCTFAETDVYAIGTEHDAAYDIVVITIDNSFKLDVIKYKLLIIAHNSFNWPLVVVCYFSFIHVK